MIKHLSLISILLATLLMPPAFASSDVGFTIKEENFSLSVRVGIGELDPEVLETLQGSDEITSADKLFFDCLKWVYANRRQLKAMKTDVVVSWSLTDKTCDIQTDETETRQFQYKTGTASQNLFRALESALKITADKGDLQTVPLYVIKSEEYIDEQWKRTDISFGAIPGYTYCDAEDVYVVLLWSMNRQSDWVKSLQKKGAKVEQVNADGKYIKHLLGNLE